eukprot:CAMPEP_0114523570 /NCGR_PEP_ID=MMETSP0109-20121206/21364_1 /TAXON_ID=29199 /ORGANISM="Chlorarachnion reptans, Strain CCCM449" /LENGTH=215 /DNA_ID=CAMNT_0001704899 /DNA_START=58 /DNA_END=705 /DNA_ORIENTATION=+
MIIFITGNDPLTWLSIGTFVLFTILPGPGVALVIALALMVVAAYLAFRFIPQVRENIHVQQFSRWLNRQFEAIGLAEEPAAGNAPPPQPNTSTPNYNERFEAAVKSIKKVPIEEYVPQDELGNLPVKDLRQMLSRRKIDHHDCVEKKELVEKIKDAGSSGESCAICVEDYVKGDLLRVMPKCGHLFHVACIDKWLYESVDYSRQISCPMCKTQLG